MNRRYFQFGLRSLFLVITLFAVWLGWELKFIRDRDDAKARADADGGWIEPAAAIGGMSPDIPLWRRYLGDEAIYLIEMPPDAMESEWSRVRRLFPESAMQRYVRATRGPT